MTVKSGVTLASGGYFKLGNLVIVNIRATISTNLSASSTLLSGLPGYSGQNRVSCTNNKKADLTIDPYGQLNTAENLSSGTLVVSAAYAVTT